MRISRCRLEQMLVAGLICLAIGCGAQDQKFESVTSALPGDEAVEPPTEAPVKPTLADPVESVPTPAELSPAINDEPEIAVIEPIEIIEPIEEEPAATIPAPPRSGATTGSWGGAKLSTRSGTSRPRVKGGLKFDTSKWEPPGVSYNSTTKAVEEPPVVEPEPEAVADIPIIEPLNADPVPAEIPVAAAPADKSPINEVDEQIRKLKSGHVAYNAPESMHYNESRVITLLLSPKESPELLEAQLNDRRDAVSEAVQHVAPRMQASLTGTGFEIEPLDPDIQLVSSLRPTQWRWRVTPNSHGPQELNYSLDAHLDLAGEGVYRIRSFDTVINVDITLKEQVTEYVTANWQWLWGTLILPIVGLRMKYGRKRRRDDWDERSHDHDRMAA